MAMNIAELELLELLMPLECLGVLMLCVTGEWGKVLFYSVKN